MTWYYALCCLLPSAVCAAFLVGVVVGAARLRDGCERGLHE